ncbi:MAG: hypothetical protein EOP11_00470 [Proteobacteria bacterium]|nr:MAG: hypothetical protein EOP11_00470 [Pseudomonadota bacterium]
MQPSAYTRYLMIASVALALPTAFAAKPAPSCSQNYTDLQAHKVVAPRPYEFKLVRDAEGNITVDVAAFRKELNEGIAAHNAALVGKDAKRLPPPKTLRVYVDNVLQGEMNISAKDFKAKLLPNEQYSVRLEALSADGRVLERTEHRLLEKTHIRAVNPASYEGEATLMVKSPLDASLGIDSEMPGVVQKIGRSKIVFVWKDPKDPRVLSLKGDIDFRTEHGGVGKETSYTATTAERKARGEPPLRFSKDDVFVKVDAAFNENSFLWDDMFTCLHVMSFNPGLCRSTVEFWLNVQKHHSQGLGDIPREVLKSNGTSFNIFETVHLGQTLPNGSYTNPNIMGDVVEALVDQTGLHADNRKLVEQVLESMEGYGKWMDEHRAVKDKNGKPMGYWISDLGSGMDNIGRAPGDDFTKVGYVDELARRIELEKSSARLNARLGNFEKMRKHEARAKELDKMLNTNYWSKEKGFYYDLVPGKDGKLVRQEDMPTVGGFWPLLSRSASPAQMKQISQLWNTAETFGGDFPVRSLPPVMDKLRPGSFYPKGGYWRGGNWAPTDIVKALGEERAGRPDLAAATINKKLAADTHISNEEVKKGGSKTVYETIGTDEAGKPIPGVQVEPDGRVHQTRKDFVGWGGTPHTFGKLRNSIGIRPVSPYAGPEKDRKKWIDAITKNPLFSNSTYFGQSPHAALPEQQKLFAEGFLEINPPFTLNDKPAEFSNYNFGGQAIGMKFENAGERNGNKLVRITIDAEGPLDVNLAYNDLKLVGEEHHEVVKLGSASPIVKVKTNAGGKKVVELELSPVK